MKQLFFTLFLIVLAGLLVFKENRIQRPEGFSGEGCLYCHKGMSDSDRSHPASAFGCSACHLGNAYSLDEKRAHATMVVNPGDLRVVERTCGKTDCHGDMADRVKKSLMATNRGILRIVQDEWGHKKPKRALFSAQLSGVADLYGASAPRNAPLDLYRKMCGGCHLWKERKNGQGEVGKRGGGCSDCHVVDEQKVKNPQGLLIRHPKMTTRIPSENCVKCHNRSARIGLSYFGIFESAGYGTPYEGADLSGRRLSGRRFYLNLEEDVHLKKGKMVCVDCHTATGLMGDGRSYDKMADQVDISCEACHAPRFGSDPETWALADRLAFLNGRIPQPGKKPIGFTRKGTPLYNLQQVDGKPVFYRKTDGRALKIQEIGSPGNAYHNMNGHDRLSCQSCHSAWIPQCYGCHLTYEKSAHQKDWITGKKTPGKWKEARTYLRFGKPALGLRGGDRIYPLSPCQVFFSASEDAGSFIKPKSFANLNLSAFDPHTTQAKSRSCIDCHTDPKSMGMGEGILYRHGTKRVFRPTHRAADHGLPFPLDGFVNLGGEALQTGAANGVRPFNKTEINRILSVDACLGCHNTYEDPIYANFSKSLVRFEKDKGLPCFN
ncbi:conserved hypothetical protein [delta proteobacterium NaphS2]|nr:conserved hypothetical protein [delta proteobacterium NaphS2]